MSDCDKFYRLSGRLVPLAAAPVSQLEVAAEQSPPAPLNVRVHERHRGESLARQRKAKLAGEAVQEPRRLSEAIAEFRQLDYEGHDSSFYVGHTGLD